jgi:hypothetical protein
MSQTAGRFNTEIAAKRSQVMATPTSVDTQPRPGATSTAYSTPMPTVADGGPRQYIPGRVVRR